MIKQVTIKYNINLFKFTIKVKLLYKKKIGSVLKTVNYLIWHLKKENRFEFNHLKEHQTIFFFSLLKITAMAVKK